MPTAERSTPRVIIIGSGFSGLCLGIQLAKAGITSFTILEKDDRLGGTWRDNTYPGAACDVPSFAYCFSFEQKTDWTRKWAHQDEILGYMEHCASKYGLMPHIRFGCEVAAAKFDADRGVWQVRTRTGEELEAEVLVSGVGQLHRPYTPAIPGLDSFAGEQFHSARWNHGVDLGGKRVGVIGNAASAIQFVPEIASRVRQLTIFQRSANWMLPRRDREYRPVEKWAFGHIPGAARLYRWYVWAMLESRYPLFRSEGFMSRVLRKYAKAFIREQIGDADLRRILVPDYPPGARRILVSDDYYAALTRDNVEVVTAPIERVTPAGVATGDGKEHSFDLLILATGFETTTFLMPMDFEGLEGRSLQQSWAGGAQAYLGLAVSGFPNLFLMYGPNTNLGHNSILFMIECQTRYIVACVRRLRDEGVKYLDVTSEAMTTYNRQLQAELAETVWAKTDHSWYKRADGRITNNWAGTTTRYWWRTRRPDWSAFHAVARRPEPTTSDRRDAA